LEDSSFIVSIDPMSPSRLPYLKAGDGVGCREFNLMGEVVMKSCDHENIEPSTVDGEVRCIECGATVKR